MYKIIFYDNPSLNPDIDERYKSIFPEDIISIELDPYYANNDDPFEIVGRKAKITIIDLPKYDWLKHLQILEFPVRTYAYPELGTTYQPPICNDFFRNLVQIIDIEDDNKKIFTGLIKRDAINYDIKEGTLEFEIYDSLYIWITASKIGTWSHLYPTLRINNIDNEDDCNYNDFFKIPLIALRSPLNNSELIIDQNYNYLLNNYQMPLPECEILPRNWSWSDIFPEEPDAYEDWMRLSRLSFIWEWKSENSTVNDMIAISFISIYRTKNKQSGTYGFKVKGYRLNYKKDNMIFYDSCFTYLSEKLNPPSLFYTRIIEHLANHKLIPYANSISIISGKAYSGYNYEIEHTHEPGHSDEPIDIFSYNTQYNYNFLDWTWDNDNFHLHILLPNAGIASASPQYFNFGTIIGTFQTLPKYIKISNPDSAKMSDIAKGLLIIYGLTMSAKPEGGIKISPHLIAKLATGEGLSDYIEIDEEDVYELSAEGIIYDLDNVLGNLSVFENSSMIEELVKYRYYDFKKTIANNYHLSVSRFYYDEFAWDNYRTILFRDKFLYVRAYSQLLKDDFLFEIDAIGN